MGELIGLIAVSAPFLMVVGIVWIANRTKLEKQRLEQTAGASAEKAAQYASRVGELENRVRVLERIVTDRGYDVATQIEALRDEQRVSDQGSGTPLDIKKKDTV